MSDRPLSYPERVSADHAALVAYFPGHSPERRFFETACRLLSALRLPITAEFGFGSMLALELSDLVLTDGSLLGSPDDPMGSIEDYATVVAVFFNAISNAPIWWKVNYPGRLKDPGVIAAANAVDEIIPTLAIVARYSAWRKG